MIDVPAEWLAAVSRSHAPLWRAQLLHRDGSTAAGDLPITGGQITRDENRTPRTEANVDVPTTTVPQLLDQALLPVGGRLLLQYSVNGGRWATMADLDLMASAIARPEDMWTVAAADRSARIAADDLGRAAVPDYTGQTIGAAITGLARRTFPAMPATVTGPAATQTVPAGYEGIGVDGDPWAAIGDLAAEAGCEVFVQGHTGTLIVRPIPGTGTPVDRLAVGESGVITGYVVKHAQAVNTVSIQYRNKDGALLRRGTAFDTRPDSPTAVQRVGCNVTHNETIRADAAPTQAAADAAAAAVLARMTGQARAAELRHPTRPWLEPGDTVAVTFLGGPTEDQVVESVGIDLGPDNIMVTRLRNSDYKMSEVLP